MVVRFSSEEEARNLGINLTLSATPALTEIRKIDDALDRNKRKWEGVGQGATNWLKSQQTAFDRARNALIRYTSDLKSLGDVGKFVFGAVLGLGAIQAVRRIIDVFSRAITTSLEFQQSMFTLEVAVRGLQRIGLDTTIAGWTRKIDDLKKRFPIFSRKEFVDAAALAALMTREFGFTSEQMQNIIDQSVILALVTGKDLNEAVRGITFAIGSGYFESLQRAGINISRQIIAQEALRRGYEGSYTALSQNIRALITYEIIQNNINAIQQDAEAIMETTTGQVQRLQKSFEDFLIVLGSVITHMEGAKESVEELGLALEILTELLTFYSQLELETPQGAGFPVSPLDFIFGANYDKYVETLPAFIEQLERFRDWLRDINALAPAGAILGEEEIGVGGRAAFIGGEEVTQEQYERYVEIIEKANKKIEDIEKDAAEKKLDILEDYRQEVEEGAENHYRRLEDIQANYEQRIADIGLKESQKVADEQADYAFRVAEAQRQAAFRREEAERRYREREINAEKRFQEKMRQLRENFLLNLEDAVRERDARQIIRLIRQYNLRRTQMEREEGLSGDERARAFQEELRQIEAQRQERMRQLAIENQRRLQEIALQAERERSKAQIEFERRREDERARWDQEKIERNEKLAEDLADLDESIQERINKVIDGLREEYSLSRDELEKLGDLYMGFYGPGGPIDVAVDYAIKRLAALNQMYLQMRLMLGHQITAEEVRTPGQAEGGTIIANKPTTVTFGEAGIEAATFTPLNRSGVNAGRVTGNLPAGLGGRVQGGKYVVGISLSPGLEAKIVDQALGEVSDVIFRVERARL